MGMDIFCFAVQKSQKNRQSGTADDAREQLVRQTRRLPDHLFDQQELLCSHYVNFREREMNKNTSSGNAYTVVN